MYDSNNPPRLIKNNVSIRTDCFFNERARRQEQEEKDTSRCWSIEESFSLPAFKNLPWKRFETGPT